MPSSVTTMVTGAFDACYRMADFYYGGTQEQFEKIKLLDKDNKDVSEAMCDSKFDKISYENKKVLVAEDNEINQCIICDYLEDFGITVELAGNGLEAYEKIVSDNSFDLVLMDIKMPVMDGYEATRKIRAYGQPYTDNIPIIAMTANAFAEDVKMAKQVGMNEHVSKPIEFDKFEDVIRNYLG
jgi:CheY-like chemotaxis protein